jgi:hypothetical protein
MYPIFKEKSNYLDFLHIWVARQTINSDKWGSTVFGIQAIRYRVHIGQIISYFTLAPKQPFLLNISVEQGTGSR